MKIRKLYTFIFETGTNMENGFFSSKKLFFEP